MVPGEHLSESSQHLLQSLPLYILEGHQEKFHLPVYCISLYKMAYSQSKSQAVTSPAGWDSGTVVPSALSALLCVSGAQNALSLESWGLKSSVSR